LIYIVNPPMPVKSRHVIFDTNLWTEGVSLCAALDSTMLPPSVSFL